MSLMGKLRSKVRGAKYVSRKANEHAEIEMWEKSWARRITPSRIEVFDTHLLFDQRTYVRCLVCGLPSATSEGYPREMTSRAIERLQELSFDNCKIMISSGVVQVAGAKAKENLQMASYNITKNQRHNEKEHKGADLELMCKEQDIVANYRQIYFNSQKTFYSSFIITIMGGASEVFEAESYIISILGSESIDVQIPTGLMLEMFLSAMPFPVSESKAWVKVRSDTAAVLCTSTNLNSRTDEKGLYFGKDLRTNMDILSDLSTLPAKHFTILGATGSGKTFSLMTLLMRMKDMLNYRIIYITPKADIGTNYKAVARYYQDQACVVDCGEMGDNINPLQILYDKQTMGDNPMSYARAYDRHKDLFIKSLKVWLTTLTDNADSYLDEALNIAYESAGIYRDKPETWNGHWPTMQTLYDIADKDAENNDLGTKQRTAEAIRNKLYQVTGKGILSYLNRPTSNLDLSKDFIVIDLSNMHEVVKDFMNVLVTGMLHSRFSATAERTTVIVVDEGGVFLRNSLLSNDLLVTLTQGRSNNIALGLCIHQPADLIKNNVSEEYKSNTFWNIVLGANIKNSIDDVGRYYNLSEDEKNTLLECGDDEGATPGQGLLMIKGQKIPIKFEPSDLEYRVIKGKFAEEKTTTAVVYQVKPEYNWLVDEQKIIFSNWTEGDPKVLLGQGYEKHRVVKVAENGNSFAYVPFGMVKDGLIDLPHFGKQSFEHYSSVVQMAGFFSIQGAEEITIKHSSDVDVSGKFSGIKVGLEYEMYDNKSPEIWMQKKASGLENYDVFRFVANSTDAKRIAQVVGEEYVIRRGQQLADFIEKLKTEAAETTKQQI